jgi:prepilin-type processing-associated H-X9-DG protein
MCPSDKNKVSGATLSVTSPYFAYAMNRVMQGGFPSPPKSGLRKRSVVEKPAQTVFLTESEADGTATHDVFSFTDGYYIGSKANIVKPRHSGGSNFVFADGHAEWTRQADYEWTAPNTANANTEWILPRKIYWYPCRICDKN